MLKVCVLKKAERTITMSLINIPEVRKWFRENIPKPKITLEGKLLARPRTKDRSITGTAFDYLLRFHLEYLNKERAITRPWIAEAGVSTLRVITYLAGECSIKRLSEKEEWSLTNALAEGILESPRIEMLVTTVDLRRVLRKAESLLKKAKSAHQRYVRSGRITDNLLGSVVRLAQLNLLYRLLYRPIMVPRDLGSVKKGHIADLRKLISIVPIENFKAEKFCILNPGFGRRVSELIGFKNADIVLDDALIDIKTTKDLKIKRQMYNQLWQYYMLSRIGRIEGPKRKSMIKRLGIYFARHAKLVTFNVNDILDTKTRKRCTQRFKEKITRLYLSGAR